MVGQDTLKSHPKIQRIARQVFEECRGLPLALTVIGKAMSTRKTPKEWQDAIALLWRSKLPEILEKDEGMFPRLKLSYDYLPDDDIRKCFLPCALWLEDFDAGWHGLIDVGGFNEAYDRGHAIIGKLKSACLLEPGEDEDHVVKMHDIIGDMARWIASDGDKNNQKLIVQSGATFCRSPAGGTLMLQKNCKLPSEISRAKYLRYLNLSSTRITRLPESLGYLTKLKFLLLRVEAIQRRTQPHHVMMWRLRICGLLDLRQPDHQLLLSNFLSSHNMSSSLQQLEIASCGDPGGGDDGKGD
ncbi:putative Disease resistance protein RPS5 [Cocos nucifera]|uniref:Putative Disease resistance protein RPS5 n=1 Tax=Cocos nucifera TaxID=13894 RepID=A0A8K0I7X6_COCNU|nr:putative Disease resistance protein RPS5 [Cocos nucifera]